jgi:hypothetical protein
MHRPYFGHMIGDHQFSRDFFPVVIDRDRPNSRSTLYPGLVGPNQHKNVNIATASQVCMRLSTQRWIAATSIIRVSGMFTTIIDFPIDLRAATNNRDKPRDKRGNWGSSLEAGRRFAYAMRRLSRVGD